MSIIPEWVATMRAAGEVQRFHTMRCLRTQKVSHHVYGMILILMAVGEAEDSTLLQAVMLHDAAELVTGDVPAPAKWKNPDLAAALASAERQFEVLHGIEGLYANLTARQQKLLAWADATELVLWALEELEMGNTVARVVVRNGYGVVSRMVFRGLSERIDEYNGWIRQEVVKHGCE